MLIFTLVTFIFLNLVKVLTPTVNWTFPRRWYPSQYKVEDSPPQDFISFPSSSKSVCSFITQPERRFPIQPPQSYQDNSFPSIFTQLAVPHQSQFGYSSMENYHPMQSATQVHPRQIQLSPQPHQENPLTDHIHFNQPASGLIVIPRCSSMTFLVSPYLLSAQSYTPKTVCQQPIQPGRHITKLPRNMICFRPPKSCI